MRILKLKKWLLVSPVFALGLAGCDPQSSAVEPNPLEEHLPKIFAQEEPVPNTLGDACYQELCTKNAELDFKEIGKAAEIASPQQDEYFATYLKKPVQQLLDSEVNLQSVLLGKLENTTGDLQITKLSAPQLALLRIPLLGTLSGVKDAKALKKLSDILKKDISRHDAVGVDIRFFGAKKYFAKKGTLQEGVERELEYILSISDKFEKEFKFSIIELPVALLQKIKDRQTLSDHELETLAKLGHSAEVVEYLIYKNPNALAFLEINQKTIQQRYENFKAYVRSEISPEQIEADALACRSSYIRAINLNPTSAQVEAFNRNSEVLRTDILSYLGPNLETASQFIKDTKFKKPKSSADISEIWVAALQHSVEKKQKQLAQISGMKTADLLLLGAVSSGSKIEKEPACNFIEFSVTDAALTGSKVIEVSALSAKYPEIGVGILAHEFGHIAYSNSIASFITAERQCLIDKQGTDQFIGEDFADFFSTKVLQKSLLEENLKTKNMGCFLASFDKVKTLKDKGSRGVHASGLYRAVNIAQLRGQTLPKSCEELIQKELPSAALRCGE